MEYIDIVFNGISIKSRDAEELQRCLQSIFKKYDLKSIYAVDENSKEENALWVIN
ncbi:MAG: hypothetical protein J1E40_01785 [Oscillospiraceae bacterium]|nr:hypothetical protein [Oscillospiraceae bacterium]